MSNRTRKFYEIKKKSLYPKSMAIVLSGQSKRRQSGADQRTDVMAFKRGKGGINLE